MPGYVDDSVFKALPVCRFPSDGASVGHQYCAYGMAGPSASGLLGKMVDEEIQLAMTGNKSIDQAIADMEERRQEIELNQ